MVKHGDRDVDRGGQNKAQKTGKRIFNRKNEAPGRKIPRDLPEFLCAVVEVCRLGKFQTRLHARLGI